MLSHKNLTFILLVMLSLFYQRLVYHSLIAAFDLLSSCYDLVFFVDLLRRGVVVRRLVAMFYLCGTI